MIWYVEDDSAIRDIGMYALDSAGFKTRGFEDGLSCYEALKNEKPDLIILDLMLPKLDGMEVCKRVRRHHNTPIIMVTARNEEIDKLLGLELGADDYITKPFSLRELNARIKAVFRRSKHIVESVEDVREFGKLQINLDRREVLYDGRNIDLTPSEYAILVTLSENVGRPYSRLQLLTATLGESYAGYERAIDTHVSNLRKKIEPNPQKPIFIQTVYGLGYKFGDKYEAVD